MSKIPSKKYFSNIETETIAKNGISVMGEEFKAVENIGNKMAFYDIFSILRQKTLTTTLLNQSDFATGTYRITTPGIYKLNENISFNPNPSLDHMPDAGDVHDHSGPAFALGFFAAISIECDSVILDLNGKLFEQSRAHALQQRFFAIIELGGSPFIQGAGPADFGSLSIASNVIICNGALGRSSHHGIHGNDCFNVLFEDLVINDFEVAGIHVNGGNNLYVKNINIEHSRQDIPVLANYSQARFLRRHAQAIVDRDPGLTFNGVTGSVLLSNLASAQTQVFTDVVTNGLDHPTGSGSVFDNVPGNTDGSVYGMVFNKRGPAVNAFVMSYPGTATKNTNIAIENVTIFGLKGTFHEVVGLSDPGATLNDNVYTGSVQTGPAGDVLRIQDITDGGGLYSSNVLSDLQMFISKHGVGTTERGATSSIHSAIISWAESATDLATVLSANNDLYYVYDGDSMSHVPKGNIGLFIQGGTNIAMKNITIENVINSGSRGQSETPYVESEYNGHSLQTLTGYGGATCRGIAVVSCKDVCIVNTNINNIQSEYADSYGIDMIGENQSIFTSNVCTNNIKSKSPDLALEDPTPLSLSLSGRIRQPVSNFTRVGKCPAFIQ